MASSLLTDPLRKAQAAVMGTSDKIADMQRDTKEADKSSRITSDWGTRQSNTDDWLKVVSEGKTGPMLLEDGFGREKIHRFDHERIPERVVHARGAGAFGKFTLHKSIENLTMAPVLTDTSRETPIFVRFSTVMGSRGSADTVRDVRGFAVKFYTQEGNWDIVGNDIPIFFIQDAMKFPDLVHAVKPEPNNEVPQAQSAHNNAWDFFYSHPEATAMTMWAMSDRGIPRSYRMIQGFGVNTFTLINAQGERHFVKFHWTPELGVHSLVWDEALKLAGQDPDFHRKDLEEAIVSGAYPKWRFGIQVIPEAQEHDFEFDILDATKVWPEELVPVQYIGELELNRMPDEYFPQVEQVAFATGHIVPGIGFSDDPLLQGRNFSYQDTQLSRLGINWEELPINRPMCPVMNFNRDGAMRHTITKGTVNYWPNRFQTVPPASQEEGGYVDYAEKVVGIKTRARSPKFKEYVSQAQLFYNSMAPHEKAHIQAALSFELDHCEDPIVYNRMVQRLADIDVELAQAVAEAVGADMPKESPVAKHGRTSRGLSQMDFPPVAPSIKTRRIAILIADGFDGVAFAALKAAATAGQATPMVIGTKRSPIKPSSGPSVQPDHHLEGFRSTMVDAVFVPGGRASIDTLLKNGRALHWVREAFGHLKAIGATGEGVELVQTAVALPSVQMSTLNSTEPVESYGVVTMGLAEASTFSEAVDLAKGGKGFLEQFFGQIAQHRNFKRETDGLSTMVAY